MCVWCLFRSRPRQKIDKFLFDPYYSTRWKNNYFIVVEFLEFLWYIHSCHTYISYLNHHTNELYNIKYFVKCLVVYWMYQVVCANYWFAFFYKNSSCFCYWVCFYDPWPELQIYTLSTLSDKNASWKISTNYHQQRNDSLSRCWLFFMNLSEFVINSSLYCVHNDR